MAALPTKNALNRARGNGNDYELGFIAQQPARRPSLPSRQKLVKMAVLTTFTTTHSVIERTMSFEQQIEQLKRQYTDKYCFVDGTRPELARFKDVVGRIKTVNMSGRALVEFDDYHLNIGWYDIAPEYLKVMDEAPPKPAKPEAKKAPAKAAPAAKEKPAAKPAAAGAAKAGKMSVAEMLAAARGGGAATPGATPAKPTAAAPTKAKAEGAPAAKVDRSKMSVADMLAAARAGGSAGAAPAAAPAPAAEKAAAPAPAKKAAAAPAASGEKVDKSKMTIEQMCDWCRQHDTK